MLFTFLIYNILFANAILSGSCGDSSGWSYSSQDLWPETCRGKSQSPIDISKNQTKILHLKRLYFDFNYKTPQRVKVTNTGSTVEVSYVEEKVKPVVCGGGLRGNYILEQFHFHWGSEHTINNKRFALEAHFVHYAEKYGTIENALNYPDGVAVIGVLYQTLPEHNHAFDALINNVPAVTKRGTSATSSKTISAYKFFPNDIHKYYRYEGSLTTPPCTEAVVWTIFALPSYISPPQLKNLTNIEGSDGKRLVRNYRDLQPLNGRTIHFNIRK